MLFCFTLALLEASNILPTRQSPVTLPPLKVADSTKLNMSQSTEFFGTVLNSSSTSDSYKTVLITLQTHEASLLAEGDVLFVPGIGYGVVTEVTKRDDSVMASVAALVTNSDRLSNSGAIISIYTVKFTIRLAKLEKH